MKAVTLSGFGDINVLNITDIPTPQHSTEQLLIRVHATALNRADLLQRRGKYPPPAGESEILGMEIAGEVIEVGQTVKNFKKGDRIFGLVGGGGYAEYCVIDHLMAIRIPDNWTYEQAAATPEAFITANETIFELGELKTGESVLIHAAGSGVGTAAVQMAHHIGAIVYGTASTEEKITKILALGATAVINYKTQDFAEAIKKFTGNKGVDVIEDFIGAEYLTTNLSILKIDGRIIGVGLMGGTHCEIDLGLFQRNRLQMKGFRLRTQAIETKRKFTQRFAERWLPILKSGQIKPIIYCTFPLEQVQQAHQAMEKNLNFGKIILTI